ncbi:MAG: molybdenum cofactor guanylyltransferase [Alphaproteobacteria bacterium]
MPASWTDALPAGCLIAGGAGSRLGGQKAEAILGDKPLFQHTLDRVESQVRPLAINSAPADWIPEGISTLPDTQPDQGPLMGLQVALLWAQMQGADWLFTAPIDCPFLPREIVQRLINKRADRSLAVIAKAGGRAHNLTALWHVDVLPTLIAHLDQYQRSAHKLIAALPHNTVTFDEPHAFFNINTPGDLKEAELLLNTPGL